MVLAVSGGRPGYKHMVHSSPDSTPRELTSLRVLEVFQLRFEFTLQHGDFLVHFGKSRKVGRCF